DGPGAARHRRAPRPRPPSPLGVPDRHQRLARPLPTRRARRPAPRDGPARNPRGGARAGRPRGPGPGRAAGGLPRRAHAPLPRRPGLRRHVPDPGSVRSDAPFAHRAGPENDPPPTGRSSRAMNDCASVDDRLEEFEDGLLEAAERRQVEHHLRDCGACRGRRERAKIIAGALTAAGDLEPERRPLPLRQRVKDRLPMSVAAVLLLGLLGLFAVPAAGPKDAVRSAKSGAWSNPETWEGGALPAAGARVLVRVGHTVLYDVVSGQAIRSVHVAGTLSFARDKDTQLDVGLIRIQQGEDVHEDGFDCHDAAPDVDPSKPRATLEVGSADRPVDAGRTARIRLVYFEGMDKATLPAIVCCGGRMDFHGAPMSRTWLKLGATAPAASSEAVLSEPVAGWKAGDRVILTATQRDMKIQLGTGRPGVRTRKVFTEERTIAALEGTKVQLDRPLEHDHL